MKKFSMAQRLYLSILLLIIIVSLITGAFSLQVALHIKSDDLDASIRSFSALIAKLPEVREMLESGKTDRELSVLFDSVTAHDPQLDVIVICDTDSKRYYHTAPDRIGDYFFGGDQKAILEGADPYISVEVGTLGLQRRAFHAVKNEAGEIIGFVMVSAINEHITQVRLTIIRSFLFIFAVCLIAGIVIAAVYRFHLQSLLLGLPLEQFVDLYIEREEVVNSLEEGLFAIDKNSRVILMNTSAKRMLDLDPSTAAEGHFLTEYYPETRLPATVKSGIAEYDVSFVIKGRNIISSRIPIRKNGEIIGAVSIFRNTTEVTKLAEELTGAKYLVDTMRAVNHEFMNKLHVILGLLEIQEVDQAKQYILNTSLVSGQSVSDIHKRVPIDSLAGLLIGKLLQANELGITFVLKQDSYFYPKQKTLPVDQLITLVGNLVENALDELNSKDFPEKRIELGIYSEEGHTTIVCDDTGGGIPEEILFSIYDPHTTTKGEGHGNGFHLMKAIVDQYEGTFHIDTELGVGSSIEILLPI